MTAPAATPMRSLRFHAYGEAAEVLRLDEAPVPSPAPDQIRVRVHACGLNPADWALCRGLFATALPRGIGLDVSGVVDALGEGVEGVAPGDVVFGAADYSGHESAGAADFAILQHWAATPPGLGAADAAALPLAVMTAAHSLDSLDPQPGRTLLVHGAGTMMGFAAVQMALMRGARVIATAGETFADRLRALGAQVTPYGEGMIGRVLDLAGAPADLVLDAAPPAGVLPDLVEIAGGEARQVLTITDFQPAAALGVRTTFTESTPMRWERLAEFGRLAAQGRFAIPVARVLPLEAWREALDLSLGRRAHGKLVLAPDPAILSA